MCLITINVTKKNSLADGFTPLTLQNKLIEYRAKSDSANRRLLEVTQLANQAQIRFEDTNEALRSTEEKLRTNEVSLCCHRCQTCALLRDLSDAFSVLPLKWYMMLIDGGDKFPWKFGP